MSTIQYFQLVRRSQYFNAASIFIKYRRHTITSTYFLFLKELEHRKLGWKVLILKYDLGKRKSEEMWCKMADTKKNDYIF